MSKSGLVLLTLIASAAARPAAAGASRYVAFDLTASPALADVEGLRPARIAGQVKKAVREPGYRIFKITEGVTAPKLVSRAEPKYTAEARTARIQGKVVLECVINSKGVPEQVTVIQGLDPGLDKNAADAVRRWVFEPGMKDGGPVPVKAKIEVNFRLN